MQQVHAPPQPVYGGNGLGPVRVKESSGWGVSRCKPEYDDLARLAEQHGLSLQEVLRRVEESRSK